MRTIESIKENEVVHCPTEEQAIAFCKLLHEAGKTWAQGDSYLHEPVFYTHKGGVCYNVNKGYHENKFYYLNRGKNIIDVAEFLPKEHTETTT